jgi:hypothetical protein
MPKNNQTHTEGSSDNTPAKEVQLPYFDHLLAALRVAIQQLKKVLVDMCTGVIGSIQSKQH